jgi:hypothetical protein
MMFVISFLTSINTMKRIRIISLNRHGNKTPVVRNLLLRVVLPVLLVLFVDDSFGQVEQLQKIQGSSGTRAGGGGLTNVAASGQSCTAVSRNGQIINYAGFIQSLSLMPSRDHDMDGFYDEIDLDNDNDGLEDQAEILGNSFSPYIPTGVNNPDTDADGMNDWAEWTADTNPTNNASLLMITEIKKQGAGMQVAWSGGVNARQYLLRSESLTSRPDAWEAIFTNQPPTLVSTNMVDITTNKTFFYKIKAERP